MEIYTRKDGHCFEWDPYADTMLSVSQAGNNLTAVRVNIHTIRNLKTPHGQNI